MSGKLWHALKASQGKIDDEQLAVLLSAVNKTLGGVMKNWDKDTKWYVFLKSNAPALSSRTRAFVITQPPPHVCYKILSVFSAPQKERVHRMKISY